MSDRRLIVNADDFGMSDGVNQGILRAFDRGIVTSASLMARRPAARQAAAAAARRPAMSLGLHLDLGEWRYDGTGWQLHDDVVDLGDEDAVERETKAQLERFVDIVGTTPTHLDSHQHVHRSEPAKGVVSSLAAKWGLPLREGDGRVRYCGSFYGQWGTGEPLPDAITVAALRTIIVGLRSGVTELGCHPGLDDALDSPYGKERLVEVATLCDDRVVAALREADVQLMSFADVPTRGT
jgi:predicted glycoside hydrolase/deacetylase ChbG (UPF0249 family)